MDALRRSVGGTRSTDAAPTPRKPAEKLKKASAGQKETLTPIAGKKTAKEGAAKKPTAGQRRKPA